MPQAFSFNREYDFVRLEGLYRATGRPAHEWDLYILKELIDNALDADEALWRADVQQGPELHIQIEYIPVPPPHCQQLLVRVRNRALFPVWQVQDIFATQWYTSRKAFLKGLTRGALGNALKTLLGIPYALHHRVADDWKPDLKPLSICCGDREYLPRYRVDPLAQTIDLECETRPCKAVPGTTMSVGLDYFVQEIPRTLADIETLAQLYQCCNPHALFHWTVDIANEVWTKEYQPRAGWSNKFCAPAPIHWYGLSDFKDLLGALSRQHQVEEGSELLPLQTVYTYFSGFTQTDSSREKETIIQTIGHDQWLPSDIESPMAKTLYATLCKYSPPFRSLQLGCIGQEHLCTTLAAHFPLEGKLEYAMMTDSDNDPSMPFVIEAAVAYLQEGKRQVWTAINFSPTYSDPFLSRWLSTPAHPDEFVLGLRGLLDAYNFREEPVILENNWLCRMDMALLQAPAGQSAQEELLFSCMSQCDLPLLVVHNGNDEGYAMVEQMRVWLGQQHMDVSRIVDLQPDKGAPPQPAIQPIKLMPADLEAWVCQRLMARNIPLKYLPEPARLRRDIGIRFEELLQEYLVDGLKQHFAITDLLMDLERTFSSTKMMREATLDKQLVKKLKQHDHAESYRVVLEMLVEEFFEQFMSEYGAKVEQMVQRWLKQQRQDG